MPDVQGFEIKGTMTCYRGHEFEAVLTARLHIEGYVMWRLLEPQHCPQCGGMSHSA